MTTITHLFATLAAVTLAAVTLAGCSDSDIQGAGRPPVPVALIEITPGAQSVAPGGSVQLTATLLDASGAELSGRTISWSSDDHAVATVTTTGLVNAVAAGTVIITASSEGRSAVAAITVESLEILLRLTLDDASDVTSPATGTGDGAAVITSPPFDFVAGQIANGLRADAIAERANLRQTDGDTRNVSLERGTVEFWYRPSYAHDDDKKYTIFGTGDWLTPGSLHLGKHGVSNENALFIIYFDAAGDVLRQNVTVDDYSLRPGVWVLIRMTWDWTVPAGVQNVHVYMDGVETPITDTPNGPVATGPKTTAAERTDRFLYIGSRDLVGTIIPNGIYDELRIWSAVLAP